MSEEQPQNPLHGVTLEQLLTRLVEHYGWSELAFYIDIRCFTYDPSIKSSLTFLRRTPWARSKVEKLYIKTIFEEDVLVNTVTTEDNPAVIDNYKKNIYPLVHIAVTSAPFLDKLNLAYSRFVVEINVLDVRDNNKEEVNDKFWKNDNRHDNLNTTYAILKKARDRMVKDRYKFHTNKAKLEDHPKFIMNSLKNLSDDQFGYDMFGASKNSFVFQNPKYRYNQLRIKQKYSLFNLI